MKQIIVPVAFFTMITLIAAGRPLIRAWARRIELGGARQPAADPDAQARLERMEAALESMALEVERLAEGQRFTTKLLADRGAAQSAVRTATVTHEGTRP